MELSDTVTLFATETFADAFNPATTFQGKMNPFAEVTNSGASSQRRILETPIDQVIPATLVITAFTGEIFIVAEENADYWNGKEIRYKYSTLPVTRMGSAGTIGETLAGTWPDTEVYAHPYFVRREIDEAERSDYLSGYELYFPRTKTFKRGDILTLGTEYYRMKTDTWIDGAGYVMCQAVRLEDARQTLDVIVEGEYNSVTDSRTSTTTADVACFVEPLRQDYEFVSPSFTSIDPGDKAISLLKSAVAVIKAGDSIDTYRVVGVRDEGDWYICQSRNLS